MASYEKHANGTWSVRFRTTENFELIYKRLRGFKTKKEAENAYIEYMNQAEEEKVNKITFEASGLKFKELYEEFIEYQKSRIKESSLVDLINKAELHILPFFEKYPVLQISPKVILQWQNSLDHLSYKYKSLIRTYLHGMLKYAERYYKIPNQIKFVDPFKNLETKQEMQIWNEDEFIKFISKVDRIDYKAFFSALYLTGARKGEILATYWSDWDLENKKLNINKNVSRKVLGKDKRYLLTTPKNKSSFRKIALSDNLVKIMNDYKDSLLDPLPNHFAFGGEQPTASSSIDNYYNSKCKSAGVNRIRLHDFRHSHASYLISKGVSIVAVAKRLGHTNIEQTLNTYSHLLKNDESDLVNKLQNINI